MTKHELRTLQQGDIVQSTLTHILYVVTSNNGDHVTVTCTKDMTNPEAWTLVARARHSPHEGQKREQP